MQTRILTALQGTRTEILPVWFMRQAGRSLPEYRKVRQGITILDACVIPDIAAEITLQPVRRHDVDAAIFFSDIVVPLRLAGIDVDIQSGVGPVFAHPIATERDLQALPHAEITDPTPISEAIHLIKTELSPTKSLIGFAGAPFTLAAYMVEGKPSKDHLAARSLMFSHPDLWDHLMRWCATVSNAFLRVQVEAGAEAVQLFDSWAGSLSRDVYQRYVLPYSKLTLEGIEVPRIHFGVNTAPFLDLMKDVGADAIGVDHRLPLDEAARILPDTPLQGNIDPAMLFAGHAPLREHVIDVVRRGLAAPSHIVNLGHGVPSHTDPNVLTDLVSFIHSLDVTTLNESVSPTSQTPTSTHEMETR